MIWGRVWQRGGGVLLLVLLLEWVVGMLSGLVISVSFLASFRAGLSWFL